MAGAGGTCSDRCVGVRDGLGAGDGAVARGEADAGWLGRPRRAAARGRIASLRDQAWRPGGQGPGGTNARSAVFLSQSHRSGSESVHIGRAPAVGFGLLDSMVCDPGPTGLS
jgi:hypothetical protein